jgi:hypothetical protein
LIVVVFWLRRRHELKLARLELARVMDEQEHTSRYYAGGAWAEVKDGVVEKVEQFLGRRVVVLSGKFGARRGFVERYVVMARGRKQEAGVKLKCRFHVRLEQLDQDHVHRAGEQGAHESVVYNLKESRLRLVNERERAKEAHNRAKEQRRRDRDRWRAQGGKKAKVDPEHHEEGEEAEAEAEKMRNSLGSSSSRSSSSRSSSGTPGSDGRVAPCLPRCREREGMGGPALADLLDCAKDGERLLQQLECLDLVGSAVEVVNGKYAGEQGMAEEVILEYEVYRKSKRFSTRALRAQGGGEVEEVEEADGVKEEDGEIENRYRHAKDNSQGDQGGEGGEGRVEGTEGAEGGGEWGWRWEAYFRIRLTTSGAISLEEDDEGNGTSHYGKILRLGSNKVAVVGTMAAAAAERHKVAMNQAAEIGEVQGRAGAAREKRVSAEKAKKALLATVNSIEQDHAATVAEAKTRRDEIRVELLKMEKQLAEQDSLSMSEEMACRKLRREADKAKAVHDGLSDTNATIGLDGRVIADADIAGEAGAGDSEGGGGKVVLPSAGQVVHVRLRRLRKEAKAKGTEAEEAAREEEAAVKEAAGLLQTLMQRAALQYTNTDRPTNALSPPTATPPPHFERHAIYASAMPAVRIKGHVVSGVHRCVHARVSRDAMTVRFKGKGGTVQIDAPPMVHQLMDMLPLDHVARSQTILLVLAHCPEEGYAYAGVAVNDYDRNSVPYNEGAWSITNNGQTCVDGVISAGSKQIGARRQHSHPPFAEGTAIKIRYFPAKKPKEAKEAPKGEGGTKGKRQSDAATRARAAARARRQTRQGRAKEQESAPEHHAGVMEWWVRVRGGSMEQQRTISGIDTAGRGVRFCVGGYGSGVVWRLASTYQ